PVVHRELIGGAVDGEDQMIAIASEEDVARLDSRSHLNGVDHSPRRVDILDGILATPSPKKIRVGARAAVQRVIAGPSVQNVRAGAAVQIVVSRTPQQGIVARLAIEPVRAGTPPQAVIPGPARHGGASADP